MDQSIYNEATISSKHVGRVNCFRRCTSSLQRKEKKRKIVNSKPLIKLYVHVLNLFSSKEMTNRPGVYITLTDLYDEK
jgi:hypothetical protein